MPVQRNQRGGSQIDRVRQRAERRALDQAKRVPWKQLAEAADEYTDWQVFALWVRAVVEAAGAIPATVAQEMESRTPQLLERIRPAVEAAIRDGTGADARIWEDVAVWAETNVFTGAVRAGWLDAVRYFSSMSLRSMKAWSHWEDIDKQWRGGPPPHLPNYAQWQREVAAVTRLSNPDSIAQQVLDAVRRVSEDRWGELLCGFSDLMAFSLWMELVLDIEGPTSRLISTELEKRYKGFCLPRDTAGSKEAVRVLDQWVLENAVAIAGQEQILGALRFHVEHQPAYPAMRRYAMHCHDLWPIACPDHLPAFEEWREAADAYCEA